MTSRSGKSWFVHWPPTSEREHVRKLSVGAMAVLACVSSLGLFASGAGAAAVTGSVSCALTGQMFISGKPLSNAHPSNGEREAILRNRTATCQGTDIAGTKDGWSIEI